MKKNHVSIMTVLLLSVAFLSGCAVPGGEEEDVQELTDGIKETVDSVSESSMYNDFKDAADKAASAARNAVEENSGLIEEGKSKYKEFVDSVVESTSEQDGTTDDSVGGSEDGVTDNATGGSADNATGISIDGAVDDAAAAMSMVEGMLKTAADMTQATITSADLNLTDLDGKGKNYSFGYNGEDFTAIYTPDNWRIIESYKITNAADMKIICQTLIDTNPVHGRDMVSYRTADDMAYEWLLHNMAYEYLDEDNILKTKAADVDFDPYDQGKGFEEIYKEKTGKDFDLESILNGDF